MVKSVKSPSQELSEKFAEEWQRSNDWLLPYMRNNQSKFLTKDEPLRRRLRVKN
jgi:hypothetical protein